MDSLSSLHSIAMLPSTTGQYIGFCKICLTIISLFQPIYFTKICSPYFSHFLSSYCNNNWKHTMPTPIILLAKRPHTVPQVTVEPMLVVLFKIKDSINRPDKSPCIHLLSHSSACLSSPLGPLWSYVKLSTAWIFLSTQDSVRPRHLQNSR